MKSIRISLILIHVLVLVGCGNNSGVDSPEGKDEFAATKSEMFAVALPAPAAEIASLQLTPEQEQFVKSGNDFALRLLSSVYEESGSSFVLSPISVQYAMGMALNGSAGETAGEITSALGFGEDLSAMNAYCRTLLEQLSALDFDVKLKMADALIMKDSYSLSETARERIESNYYAPVVAVSFGKAGGVMTLVNDWFQRSTEGLFPSIVDDLSPQAVSYLLSGIYFKAGWLGPYTDVPGKVPFYADGEVLQLDYIEKSYAPLCVDLADCRLVSFALGKGKFVLNLILPTDGYSLSDVLSSLTEARVTEALSSRGYKASHIMLPAFTTESSLSLKSALETCGIEKAFDGKRADFSTIVSEPGFYIDDVLHKAKLSWDKNGTTGADPVQVPMAIPSEPGAPEEVEEEELLVNRPFAYFISEYNNLAERFGAILFAGVFDGK